MMSEPASEFLTMLRDHIAEVLSAGGVIGGGMLGFLAGRKKNEAEAAKAEAEAIIAPFRVLIDGYEAQAKADGARIEDLMREVMALREEVKALRQALDQRPRAGS
jgi:hypothetical protein